MPALQVIKTRFFGYSTRPFGGDDLQLVCILFGVLRLIQFVCLVPWAARLFWKRTHGKTIWINGIPPWCPQYPDLSKLKRGGLLAFREDIGDGGIVFSFESDDGPQFIAAGVALLYFAISVCWLCMISSATSLGTPTQPERRDKYLRPLILFQLIAGAIFPIALLFGGIWTVHHNRLNNYRCGQDVVVDRSQEDQVYYRFYSVLMVTYALELLFWPSAFVGNIVRLAKKHGMFEGKQDKEHRLQCIIGLVLRCLQCISCGKVGGKEFKNKELNDFAVQFMELANYETQVDFVLSDIYIGFHMVARDQLEQREAAIRSVVKENNFIRDLVQPQIEKDKKTDDKDPFASHTRKAMQKTGSIYILQQTKNFKYEVRERKLLLESNEGDQALMQDLSYYSIYAQIIYEKLRILTVEEFGLKEGVSNFTRGSGAQFESRYRLSSLDCEHAMLFYASFLNGMISTPYAILVDTSAGKVIITVRGTHSIEDMVIDMQYRPASLEKVGLICGSDLKGHFCHKGLLARSKWLYNSLRSEKVLKTLYSDESPFKDYDLVVCGHSMGAGCAILLAVMLRPSYPSIKCFAYEPPGALLDEGLCTKCEDFVVSTVRQDDFICRTSHQSFDAIRDNFFDILARIKVPKIQAFYDIRTPCGSAFIKQRNSAVLRPQTDIPTDTVFYQRLQKFREERSEADYMKLWIPGKIVHLLDPGDGRPHIPYYASKHQFDHIVISKTMASDHMIVDLIEVLQNAQLSGGQRKSMVSFKFNDSIKTEEEEKIESPRFFMLCSNPQGSLPILLTTGAFIAVIFSILSNTRCDIFTRFASGIWDGDEISTKFNSVGLYSVKLLDCGHQNCTLQDELIDYPRCIPLSIPISNLEWFSKAQIFAACQMGFAFPSLLALFISTCYRIKRYAWIAISFMLLLSTLFQCLVFVLYYDSCGDWDSLTITCYVGPGGSFAITACCLYFITALGSIFFACRK